jgi:hypothetical protein
MFQIRWGIVSEKLPARWGNDSEKSQWEENDRERLSRIRQSLLKIEDYHLKTILSRLRRPEICSPETYQELIRTPRIQERLIGLGLMQKPLNAREKRRQEIEKQRHEAARLMSRYDRAKLYEQVWSCPVREVATLYGISGVMLGKVCRKLQVPVPPRGYWARVRSGYAVRKPALPELGVAVRAPGSPACVGP